MAFICRFALRPQSRPRLPTWMIFWSTGCRLLFCSEKDEGGEFGTKVVERPSKEEMGRFVGGLSGVAYFVREKMVAEVKDSKGFWGTQAVGDEFKVVATDGNTVKMQMQQLFKVKKREERGRQKDKEVFRRRVIVHIARNQRRL